MFILAALALMAAAPPVVTLEEPVAGWTTERIVTVKGRVDGAADLGTLSINGVERPLPMRGGSFIATVALARGENAIEVVAPAKDRSPPGRARLNLHAQIPRVDLQVILYWDTDQTDVDLHVIEPSGEVVNYTHTVGASGGRLDRDDTDGFGPEIYTLGAAPSGSYAIAAHYFGDRGTGQTTATVSVVAREGTDEERRWRFEVPLVRQGEKVMLGRVSLPPPGSARSGEAPRLAGEPAHTRDARMPRARR